jgi:hypothetical protein
LLFQSYGLLLPENTICPSGNRYAHSFALVSKRGRKPRRLALPHALAANFHCQRKGFPWGLTAEAGITRRFARRALDRDPTERMVICSISSLAHR